ncbi:unnamed protein product [Polarella glacialis]|uniref:Uncharacterized protein n=1 Tax=Polarella glacialis TaxID=89957 RepID=A0A813LSA6_POLGL|nr:unnamed protein product [Polarella glacialis]
MLSQPLPSFAQARLGARPLLGARYARLEAPSSGLAERDHELPGQQSGMRQESKTIELLPSASRPLLASLKHVAPPAGALCACDQGELLVLMRPSDPALRHSKPGWQTQLCHPGTCCHKAGSLEKKVPDECCSSFRHLDLSSSREHQSLTPHSGCTDSARLRQALGRHLMLSRSSLDEEGKCKCIACTAFAIKPVCESTNLVYSSTICSCSAGFFFRQSVSLMMCRSPGSLHSEPTPESKGSAQLHANRLRIVVGRSCLRFLTRRGMSRKPGGYQKALLPASRWWQSNAKSVAKRSHSSRQQQRQLQTTNHLELRC